MEDFISMQLWIQASSLSAETGVLGMYRKDSFAHKMRTQLKLRDDIEIYLVKNWKVERVGGGKLETLPMRHKTNLKFSTRQQQFEVKLRANCI